MRTAFAPMITNQLLAELPMAELSLLQRHLVRVRLVCGQVLIERGQAAEHVFFIENGIVMLMANADQDRAGVQVAMIGCEGMVGGLALLDGASAAYAGAIVQMPGGALRIPAAQLRSCLEESTVLRDVALRFVQSLTRQIMGTAASNASCTLAERCVQWLLMAHERMDGDDLPVTHEALSALLGVRRSGVTVATAALQERALIRTSRGRIRVLDRPGLEMLAARRGVPLEPRPLGRRPASSRPDTSSVRTTSDSQGEHKASDGLLALASGHSKHVRPYPSTL